MLVGARYYDAQVGRFITRDTVLTEKPYLYCEHDPVNHLDPSGHEGTSGHDDPKITEIIHVIVVGGSVGLGTIVGTIIGFPFGASGLLYGSVGGAFVGGVVGETVWQYRLNIADWLSGSQPPIHHDPSLIEKYGQPLPGTKDEEIIVNHYLSRD